MNSASHIASRSDGSSPLGISARHRAGPHREPPRLLRDDRRRLVESVKGLLHAPAPLNSARVHDRRAWNVAQGEPSGIVSVPSILRHSF